VVCATEVVDEGPKNREDPKEEHGEQDHGPEHAKQWVVIGEHGFS
jgi:hypothetical protein